MMLCGFMARREVEEGVAVFIPGDVEHKIRKVGEGLGIPFMFLRRMRLRMLFIGFRDISFYLVDRGN